MEVKFFKTIEEVPEERPHRKPSKYAEQCDVVDEFMARDDKAVMFSCKNANEANGLRTYLKLFCGKKHYIVVLYARGHHVYVIKG